MYDVLISYHGYMHLQACQAHYGETEVSSSFSSLGSIDSAVLHKDSGSGYYIHYQDNHASCDGLNRFVLLWNWALTQFNLYAVTSPELCHLVASA